MKNYNNFSINYKQDMKECSIITRIKILKPLIEKKISQIDLAKNLGIGKNTIYNTVKLFNQNYNNDEYKKIILNSQNYEYDFLRNKFEHLGYKSRVPNSNSKSIKPDSFVGQQILKLHQDTNKGHMNMNTFLKRIFKNGQYEEYGVTQAKIRGFYKKNKLIHKKVKSENREVLLIFKIQWLFLDYILIQNT